MVVALHTSKQGVVLDLDVPVDGVDLSRAGSSAGDIVLEAERPGALAAGGSTGPRSWRPARPHLGVGVAVRARRGPGRQDPVTDLTLMAGGGPVWSCGYDDHSLPPVRGGGDQARHVAGVHAVTATWSRWCTVIIGLGQHIDVNMHAGLNVTTELGRTRGWWPATPCSARPDGTPRYPRPRPPS